MKPQELQNVIEIRKALIEQGKHLNFDYLESAYQWVIDAPEKEEREDRLFAAVQAFNTKKHYKDVFDWIFKGVFKEWPHKRLQLSSISRASTTPYFGESRWG